VGLRGYKWMGWMDGLDWILLRTLVQLEHLAVLKRHKCSKSEKVGLLLWIYNRPSSVQELLSELTKS